MDLILQQLVNGLALGGAYTLVALGLFLLYNCLHLPNFAHGEMYALGAYFQYTFTVALGLPFLVGTVGAMVCAALVSIILERIVFRPMRSDSGFTILIGSLALAIVLQEVIALAWGRDLLAVPSLFTEVVDIGGVRISAQRLLVILVVLVATAALAYIVYRTTYGRSLRAIAQNREVAILSGIDVSRVTVVTFAIAGALAGLAGALIAPTTSIEPHMGFHPTLVAFAILVVIGGGARLTAVVIGAFVIAVGETIAAALISSAARTAVVFIALVIFLLIRPEGARRVLSEVKGRL